MGTWQYPGFLHGQWRRGQGTVREIRLIGCDSFEVDPQSAQKGPI
jgi:hypothetical protein